MRTVGFLFSSRCCSYLVEGDFDPPCGRASTRFVAQARARATEKRECARAHARSSLAIFSRHLEAFQPRVAQSHSAPSPHTFHMYMRNTQKYKHRTRANSRDDFRAMHRRKTVLLAESGKNTTREITIWIDPRR